MAIKWKDPEAKDRLIAAVLASCDRVDIKEVARLFGQGATYDAVECQLRKAKKQAAELKDEAASRSGPALASSRSKKTNLSESPVKIPLKNARVTKPRKRAIPKIKTELLMEESMLFDDSVNIAAEEEFDEV